MKNQLANDRKSDRAVCLLPKNQTKLIATWRLIEGKLTCVWLNDR